MPTLATLSRLTDLALGTPNVGSVNFTVLHTLIHSILDKLGIGNANAEIQEEDHEFLRRHLVDKDQLLKASDTDLEKSKSDNNLRTGAKDGKISRPGSGMHVPYHQLEDRVIQLEQHWKDLNSLPANSELFERVREKDAKPRPVAEMWTTMKLSKSVDAHAQGIGKLMSMFEDILEDTKMLKESNTALARKLTTEQASAKEVDNLKEQLENLKKTMGHMGDRLDEFPGDDFFDSLPTWAALEAYFKGLREKLDQTIEEKSQPLRRRTSSRPPIPGPTSTLQSILEQLGILTGLHNDLVARVDKLESTLAKTFETKMSSLEEAVAGDKKEIQKLAAATDRLICRIQGIEDQICCLRQVINRLRGSDADTCGIMTTDEEITCLRNLVNKLQCEVDMLRCFGQGVSVPSSNGPVASGHVLQGGQNGAKGCGNALACGPNGNKSGCNAFCCPPQNLNLESDIQSLFCIVNELDENKMDKCQMVEELNQKADRGELEDKVSQMCFDMACEGLHTVINDILQKLLDSGDVVHNITFGLESKLNRDELDGFKEQLEAKLRCLAKRLVTLQRKCDGCDDTNDAAGTRRPLLTKQHCLSCDRVIKVTPKEAVPSIPAPPGLPMGKVMKNYTKYELDQLKTLVLCQGQVTSKPIDSDPFSVFRNCGGRSRSPPRQCPTPAIDCDETADNAQACKEDSVPPQEAQVQGVPVTKMKVTGGYTPCPPNPYVRPQSAMVTRPTETARATRPASACHPSTSAQNFKARTAACSTAPPSLKTDIKSFVLDARNTLERSLARNNTEQCKGKGRLNGSKSNLAVQKSGFPSRPPRYASGRTSVQAGGFQRGKPGGRDQPTKELARPCTSYGRKPVTSNTGPCARFDGTEEEEEEEECHSTG